MTAAEALDRLKEGNERFLEGHARFPTLRKDILIELTRGQSPFATMLGCSDSRVPPELIFDAGFGDLFIIRVAGNVLAHDVLGSLQYAGAHLGTPLFVLLGHEGCGAVKAAIESKLFGKPQKSRIQMLVDSIVPGLPDLDPDEDPERRLARAVESNVRWTMRQLLDTPEAKDRVSEGRMKLVGAVCEIATGRVRFLD